MAAKTSDAELTLEEKFHRGKGGGLNLGEGMPEISFTRKKLFAAISIIAIVGGAFFPIVGFILSLVAIMMVYFTLRDPQCGITLGFLPKIEEGDDYSDAVEMFSLSRGAGAASSKKASKGDTSNLSEDKVYNKFIDVLIRGGIIDRDTERDDIKLKVVRTHPATYELEMYQIGKTERQLVGACENALLAYNAYVVEVEEIGDTRYRIAYVLESEIARLAAKGLITYNQMLDMVEQDDGKKK